MIDPTPVRQAQFAFEHKDGAGREWRVNTVLQLAEWKLFSNNQIALFTGLSAQTVARYTQKSDYTGGALSGESLPLLLEIIFQRNRGELDMNLFRQAHEAGASKGMITRLTGIPLTSVRRYITRASV